MTASEQHCEIIHHKHEQNHKKLQRPLERMLKCGLS